MLINTGKFSLVDLKIGRYRLTITYFITEDCSIRLRSKGLLTIIFWNKAKIKYKKEKELIKLIW